MRAQDAFGIRTQDNLPHIGVSALQQLVNARRISHSYRYFRDLQNALEVRRQISAIRP